MRIRLIFLMFVAAACAPVDLEPATTPTPAATDAPATASLDPTTTAAPPATSLPSAVQFPDPSGVQWTPVVDGLQSPLDIQHASDGRLFVVEQAGVVRVIEGDLLSQQPLLDIRARVGSSGNEQGLLGLAFHPEFEHNGFFFVNYTDLGGDTVVARYQVDVDRQQADPTSELVLLRIDQPFANHNGGDLAFGPDGYLYIGTGDGGSAGDPLNSGQRTDTLLGKLLRLDVDAAEPYAIPADNPFAGGGGLPEIWAYGLRNPWRFAFDRARGDLYIGDVGQNLWEEVDFLSAGSLGGANFGWNLREGQHAYATGEAQALIDPVAEYGHGAGCSVTGGIVVRDPAIAEWQGVYLYGDYCTGTIWGLVRDAQGNWRNRELFRTAFSIASFGEDASGAVYLVDHLGAVYRLERVRQAESSRRDDPSAGSSLVVLKGPE